VQYVDSSGVQHLSQPAFSNISGSPSTTQVPFQSLTTTGTNGAATLSGGVLNIPQYSGGSSGFPQQLAAVSLTGQTAAASNGTWFSTTAAGTYRISAYIWTQVAGTAGTIDVDWSWNNGTSTEGSGWVCSTSATTTTPNSVGCSGIFHAPSSANITYNTLLNGVTGSPQYGLDVVLERLQ
jgi:hypothetical protein